MTRKLTQKRKQQWCLIDAVLSLYLLGTCIFHPDKIWYKHTMPSQSIRSDPSTNMVCIDNNLIEGSKVAYFPETTLPFERITSVHLQPLTATICQLKVMTVFRWNVFLKICYLEEPKDWIGNHWWTLKTIVNFIIIRNATRSSSGMARCRNNVLWSHPLKTTNKK